MSLGDWHPLPQRTRRRRRPDPSNSGVGTKKTLERPPNEKLEGSQTGLAPPDTLEENDTLSTKVLATSTEEREVSSSGTIQGTVEQRGDVIGRVCPNLGAVTAAVDERARTKRYIEGVESGAGRDGANYEYLDHTADVQLHSWGDSLEVSLGHLVASMFNVITDLDTVEVDPDMTREHTITGHDMLSLIYSLMDELLFVFHAEGLVVKHATVLGKVDRESWVVRIRTEGEKFKLTKHPQGTEVKAITFANMQVHEEPSGKADLYVIVDI